MRSQRISSYSDSTYHAQFLPQSLLIFFPVPVRQEARVYIRVLAEFALGRRLAVLVCFLVLVVCCFLLLALVLQFEGEGGDLAMRASATWQTKKDSNGRAAPIVMPCHISNEEKMLRSPLHSGG